MSIDGIPKVKGGPPTSETPASKHTKPETEKPKTPLEAMDKPTKAVSEPDRAELHPSRQAPAGKPQLFEKEAAELRRMLKAAGQARLDGAAKALALCASYRMRRSRGARRRALELCDDVAENVEEYEELAKKLHTILEAEGDLHDLSADATLRACKALVEIIDDGDIA